MQALAWLGQSPLAQALAAWPTLYIFINGAHILAIGLLLGAILPLDLRLIGFFPRFPLNVLGPFLSRAALTGVLLAMLTGSLLFSAKPVEYMNNPAFLTKLGLLAVGLANALLLHAHPAWRESMRLKKATTRVRVGAGISMLAWLSVLLAGRWIGFL
jgi:hypothetical protein